MGMGRWEGGFVSVVRVGCKEGGQGLGDMLGKR